VQEGRGGVVVVEEMIFCGIFGCVKLEMKLWIAVPRDRYIMKHRGGRECDAKIMIVVKRGRSVFNCLCHLSDVVCRDKHACAHP
jgi:hypothetical protein